MTDAETLLAAIKEHRDQKGDDRCWLDDQKLYAAAGLEPADTALPCRNDFLRSCERYWCQRQTPEERTRPPGKTIGQMEREIATLTVERNFLRGMWTRAVIKDKQTGINCNPLTTYERASAEGEAVVAHALAEFRKASDPEATP